MKKILQSVSRVAGGVFLVGALTLGACATKQDVENIVAEANAQVLAVEFGEGTSSDEKILQFIERNPELTAVNQRLLVRLSAIYAAQGNTNLALAALEKASKTGDVNQLGDRDALIVELRGPIIWQRNLPTQPTEDDAAVALMHMKSARDFPKGKAQMDPQLKAWVLSVQASAARVIVAAMKSKESTHAVQEIRSNLDHFLTDYGTFWGEAPQKKTVAALRNNSSSACATEPADVDFSDLDAADLPDLSLLRFAGAVICSVETVVFRYSNRMTDFSFDGQPADNDTPAQTNLRKMLDVPSWLSCPEEIETLDKFNCTIKIDSEAG
ncbi:hypothetical protein [Leisingera sp. M658]|uniref:hypothetical protein n=1 Tax=Leisingera sp. M658 TaxID=2867015 RepID=UPI0021A69328|nr:hypothetical protein [Leisingera sp. M658]UWQ74405.1 hypothetical protein K3724_18275 [Leisingera sp. M658]